MDSKVNNKGFGTWVALFSLSTMFIGVLLFARGVESQNTNYNADHFFTNLIHNEAGLGHGVAIFEFKNPLQTDIAVDDTTFKIRMEDQPGATPIQSMKYYVLENVPISEKITDYENVCTESPAPNGSITSCNRKISGWHWNNYTRDVWHEFSNYVFKAGRTYRIKIEGTWQPRTGFMAREWFPRILVLGNTYEQLKWDWWNASYNYRYQIIQNESVEESYAINDNRTVNGTVIWAKIGALSEPLYVYSTQPGPSGQIAIANETHEKFWENETSRSGYNSQSVWGDDALVVFHFGESTGTSFSDSSRYGNIGSLNGSARFNSSGKLGYGIELPTYNSDFAEVPHSSSFQINNNRFSFEAWFFLTKYAPGGGGADGVMLMSKTMTASGDAYFQLDYTPNPQIPKFVVSGCASNPQGSQRIELNKWYHIVGVHNSSHSILYIEGVAVDVDSCSGLSFSPSGPLRIGRLSSSHGFQGVVDEVRIYNRSLSSDEVRRHYSNGIGNFSRLESEEILSIPSQSLNRLFYSNQPNNTINITVVDGSGDPENASNITTQIFFRNESSQWVSFQIIPNSYYHSVGNGLYRTNFTTNFSLGQYIANTTIVSDFTVTISTAFNVTYEPLYRLFNDLCGKCIG